MRSIRLRERGRLRPKVRGYRYWRVRLDAGGVFGNVQALARVQLRSTIGGANIAGDATVTASTTLSGHPATNVQDADASTYWASTQAGNGWNQWLAFDFGTPVKVAEIALTARNTGSDHLQATLAGALEYSADGSTWKVAFPFHATANYTSGSTQTFSAPPAPDDAAHRYWEMRVVRATTNGNTVITSNTAAAELQFRESIGGANTLSGGTVSVSNAEFGAGANAVDGNGATIWATGAHSMMQWFRYDYGAGNTRNIREVAVTARNDSFSHQAPGQIILRYSDDGTNWTTKFVSAPQPTPYTAAQVRTFSAPT